MTCVYLLILAVVIQRRAVRNKRTTLGPTKQAQHKVPAISFVAGLLDAIGGGGWGALSTSTLLASGGRTRATIGTVNLAEFAVTLAVSLTFVFTVGMGHAQVVAGLVIGGVIAAPLAAVMVKRLPERFILASVGMLSLVGNAYQIVLCNR